MIVGSDQKELLLKEIREFDKLGKSFVQGDITSSEFKSKSGGMGVYAQRGGKKFMIRLRIMSGILESKHFGLVLELADKYELNKIHLTTRQTIQLHDLSFDQVIEVMEKSIENDLYTRGGGGNYPRNVALSPLSGVEVGEAFDPTEYAMKLNHHFLGRISSYHLPRKLKVAFANSMLDSAICQVNDLGFVAVKKGDKKYFRLYMGGGLGNSPELGIEYDALIEPEYVLDCVDAMTNLYMEEGDYQNKSKARLRFVMKRLGAEVFSARFKDHLQRVIKARKYTLSEPDKTFSMSSNLKLEKTEAFGSIVEQKQPDRYSLVLHPQAGQLSLEAAKRIFNQIENNEGVEIRLGMDQSMYLRNLTMDEAKNIAHRVPELCAETRLRRSISCIGTPTCQIGIQQSQNLLREIVKYFGSRDFNVENIMPAVNISGCVSSCARHQTSLIGFSGKRKKYNDEVVDAYSLFTADMLDVQNLSLGEFRGDLAAEIIPEFLYRMAEAALQSGLTVEEYISDETMLGSLLREYTL